VQKAVVKGSAFFLASCKCLRLKRIDNDSFWGFVAGTCTTNFTHRIANTAPGETKKKCTRVRRNNDYERTDVNYKKNSGTYKACIYSVYTVGIAGAVPPFTLNLRCFVTSSVELPTSWVIDNNFSG
jgi:hypothetical protein